MFNKSGDTDVVVDIFGYYSSHTDGAARFTAQAPVRLLDTRTDNAPLGPGGEASIQIRGGHNVPTGATAAVLNVTATGPDTGGYFTVYPSGGARPGTSNLNFVPGRTVANHVTTPLGTDGAFDVYNSSGNTQVVADLFGYFRKWPVTHRAASRRCALQGRGAFSPWTAVYSAASQGPNSSMSRSSTAGSAEGARPVAAAIRICSTRSG